MPHLPDLAIDMLYIGIIIERSMNTITVSATHARNNFFELLNLVADGQEVVVERDNKKVARLVPGKKVTDLAGLTKALEAAAKGFVYNPKDNPLRRTGASGFLGRWDTKL